MLFKASALKEPQSTEGRHAHAQSLWRLCVISILKYSIWVLGEFPTMCSSEKEPCNRHGQIPKNGISTADLICSAIIESENTTSFSNLRLCLFSKFDLEDSLLHFCSLCYFFIRSNREVTRIEAEYGEDQKQHQPKRPQGEGPTSPFLRYCQA